MIFDNGRINFFARGILISLIKDAIKMVIVIDILPKLLLSGLENSEFVSSCNGTIGV